MSRSQSELTPQSTDNSKELPHGFIQGEVLTIKHWSSKVFSLTVAVDEFHFTAGQFTKLGLLNHEGKVIRRAYSMVNAPQISGPQLLEFLIIRIDDGLLSPPLHQLQSGDAIYVGQTATGFMTLDELPEKVDHLWLLSTGTAIGPFLSLIESILSGAPFAGESINLVHAVRTKAELVYQERILKWVHQSPIPIHYMPIVSREPITPHEAPYPILDGRIPARLADGSLAKAAGITLTPDSFFYICGNPAMVKDTAAQLSELGYSKHLRRKPGQFSSENYW
ncbi:MAG: ferredoxin--NADP reductase [Vibrio sp.]